MSKFPQIATKALLAAAPHSIATCLALSIGLAGLGLANQSIGAVASVAPPAQLNVPWAVGEQGQLLNGPHTNNADVCNYPTGAPCNALDLVPASGIVRAARAGIAHRPCGNLVMVDHGDGWATGYYHLTNIPVTDGQSVSQGQVLGSISALYGCGGYAVGAHVHFFVKYSPGGYASMGGPFGTGPDVDLQSFVIGGWRIDKSPSTPSGFAGLGGCMTYVSTSENVCTPNGRVTNHGVTTSPPRPVTGGVALRADGVSGYAVDGFGNITPFGGAPAPSNPSPTWGNWDIVRGIALRPDGISGYVLDGYGGVHPFGGAPAVSQSAYWSGSDIARGISLRPDGVSGYVLDGYGGVHPFGGAPAVSQTAYWSGWDIARAIALDADGNGGQVLDAYGALHRFGNAPALSSGVYWNGWDIARGVALLSPSSGYVLDGWGGVHPFGAAPYAASASYHPPFDTARGIGVQTCGSQICGVVAAFGDRSSGTSETASLFSS